MAKPCLLIVEDEPSQLRRLVTLFEKNYHVYSADTGKEAIRLFGTHQLSLVALILDIRLPDMTAFQILDSFEKMSFPGIPPTVIQTAFDDQSWVLSMLGEYRALAYLTKPFTDQKILTTLDDVLQVNPRVFKWTHTDEQMAIMVAIRHIRTALFQKVDRMAEPEKSTWMPAVLDLFQGYGEKEIANINTKFKLKGPLTPILTLVYNLMGIDRATPKPVHIGFVGSEKKEAFIREILAQKDPFLFEFDVVPVEHTEALHSKDFILVDLDLNATMSSYVSDLYFSSQPDSKEQLAPYIIGLTSSGDYSLLERGTRDGMLFGYYTDEAAQGHLYSLIAQFAQRRHDIKALQGIVEVL